MSTTRQFRPTPLEKVAITDSFWAPRQETNRTVTLPIQYQQCKETGRIDAFRLDWTPDKGAPPHIFWDSDVAKWIEAAGYSLATRRDPKLEELVDGVIDLVVNAQQPDGYLNVHFTVAEPEKRWTNLRDCHELYCAGHLMEAAVAYHKATGKRKLLDALCRYADCIDSVFGPGKRAGYPGHEEIELALVKLYHATGEQRYLRLSQYFVDERGRPPHLFNEEAEARGDDPKTFHFRSYEYNQSHVPVREQTEVVGHAVRAMYLYSGMADVANERGDATLLEACQRLWGNVALRRMYVTGGIGPTRANEGFTFDYDLPNETAYAETCAAIGLVFWAHRMLQFECDSRYADVMERALYNGTISGVSLSGDRFFYVNPLSSLGDHHRQEWFGCACCPPNIARLIASVGQYVYSESEGAAAVHLYVQGTGELNVAGQIVKLAQETDYPREDRVKITVTPEKPTSFVLRLRIPGWCRAAAWDVNGQPLATGHRIEKGYLRIEREWSPGDVVELTLPMPIERIESHPAVRQDAGRIALQRGPLVYCLEGVDNGQRLHDLVLPTDPALIPSYEPDLLGGIIVLTGQALRRDDSDWDGQLYRPVRSKQETVPIRAVPYCVWDNREAGEMIVWINAR